ncbi:hypothetical protein BKA62DRAFT_313864 [Auriculariales sp. MPI-PUGE-AT-0066]|nr:hypothetical protein BKA62DRAFT_313864 [Auriculariales sp. MPI-PUGE-AT-0066]
MARASTLLGLAAALLVAFFLQLVWFTVLPHPYPVPNTLLAMCRLRFFSSSSCLTFVPSTRRLLSHVLHDSHSRDPHQTDYDYSMQTISPACVSPDTWDIAATRRIRSFHHPTTFDLRPPIICGPLCSLTLVPGDATLYHILQLAVPPLYEALLRFARRARRSVYSSP